MFRRLSNSWELTKASWQVLQKDKELMIFPVIAFFASIIVMITFAVPSFLAGLFDATVGSEIPIMGYIIGFLFYVCLYFVTIFSNSALIGAAMIRLEGGDPTVRDGLDIAMKHIGSIFGYAIISATVGMILRFLSERAGIIGRIVIGLIGFAWTVATFLVIPVLVIEGVGPMEAVQRSAGMLKKTWGEQIIGNLGVGAVFGLMTFGVILVGIPIVILAAATESVVAIVLAIALIILVIMALVLVSNTLSGIYIAAVYRYATTGEAGNYFDASMVEGAFKPKK
ncbi:MAG: DUF6159 family protein [Chloroflexota bacterium]